MSVVVLIACALVFIEQLIVLGVILYHLTKMQLVWDELAESLEHNNRATAMALNVVDTFLLNNDDMPEV